VIVLNYNGRELLTDCLTGCEGLDRDGVDLSVVCIDNGSADGSVGAVRAHFPDVEVIGNKTNLGFAPAYNQAIRAVDADWIALLNNDAVPDAAWVTSALDAAARNGAVCVASRMVKDGGRKVDFVGASMNFYGHGFHPHFDDDAVYLGEEGPVLFACAGAMICRRDVFLAAGGFDADYFAYFEDVDLGWRLNVLGHDVVYAPESLVRHAYSATSASRVPPYQKLAWLERNGLRSVIKNYDDHRLARVLPVAMALVNKRAELDSAIDPDSYFFEKASDDRSASPEPGGGVPGGGRGRKVASLIRQRGVVDGVAYAAYRGLARRYASTPAAEGSQGINQIGFSRVAALEAVSRDAMGLRRRRDEVQAARKRPDDAIVELFRDTYKPSFPHPEIKRLQDALVEAFELQRVL
jgi:GT2 family glycosyltransferase